MSTLAPPTVRAITRSESGIGPARAEVAAPRPGEALLRLIAIGLGSPDVAIAAGRIPFRGVMGREFVATVERVEPRPGRDTDLQWVGKRVVGQPFIPCGACEQCRGGLASVCPARVHPGLRGRDGSASELFTFPLSCLHAVPAGVNDDAAILSSSLASALRAIHACGADARSFVTILGDGAVGLLCAQVALAILPHARLLGLHRAKFGLCERWGVPHRHVRDVGARHDQHAVIDASGSEEGLSIAAGLVLPRGRIVRVTHGAGDSDLSVPAGALAGEVVITGIAPPSPSEALSLLASGRCDITGLISKRFSLDDGSAAIRAASEPNTVKVILTA